ncbi:helix-turn-helix domain-containing protein [Streptomyces sp. NPDC056165]|uniref:helix-turn-helix domain-containing protein n=1 Tax=Streptomyces sp. NPDC056165 TaxID=3345733 RepID=UPI0035DA3948
MTAPPKVSDLLADPLLRDARTLAGHAGLECPVTDVTPYRGTLTAVEGHLVLCDARDTTPAYRLDALVRRAQEAGAAALCVTADATARPPLSAVRLADRLRIPVLWAATDDPLRLALDLTLRVRAPEVVRARTVETLVRRLGTRTEGPDLLTAARGVLAADISLVTSDGSAILGDPVPWDGTLRPELAVPQRTARLLAHPVHDSSAGQRSGAAPVPAAWLVWPYQRADEDRADTVALGLAVLEPFVRSWLATARTRADHDSAARRRLLEEVVGSRATVSREVVERAVALGWRLEDWHVGLRIRCETAAADRPDTVGAQLGAALARHGVAVHAVAERDGGWALWTSSVRQPAPDEARLLLREVRRALAELPRRWRPVAGIGWPHQGPGGLADTLTEARNAARLAGVREFRPSVELTDELGVARLLATWQQSDITQAFAETALAPLRDADHAHLLTTLRVFLENGGSSTATARALGLHRNTVTARLRQVRDRLGVDLDDPGHRLALQMACRAVQPAPE